MAKFPPKRIILFTLPSSLANFLCQKVLLNAFPWHFFKFLFINVILEKNQTKKHEENDYVLFYRGSEIYEM